MFKSTSWDKAPLQSKKFLAYMFASFCMKLYLFYATSVKEGDFIVMASIICTIFLDISYIAGQAALDKYVRVAAIVSGKDQVIESSSHETIAKD